MKIEGYEGTTTGGGCTALERDLGGKDGEHVVIMLTDEFGEPTEPTHFPLTASVYTANGYDYESSAIMDGPEMLKGYENGVRARFGL